MAKTTSKTEKASHSPIHDALGVKQHFRTTIQNGSHKRTGDARTAEESQKIAKEKRDKVKNW